MNKRILIFSSVFLFLAILLGIKTYDVLADTQNVKKNTSILQTTIEDRAIAIGTDGMVKIFETKIVSIDGAIIKTESMINDEPITFIISTDPRTKIYKNGTSTVELSTMQVDDLLTVAGNLDSLIPEISITAQEIRIIDLSKGQMKKDAKVEDTATTSESNNSNDEVIVEDQSSTTTVITNEETEATTTIEVQDDANIVPTDTDVQSAPETTVTEDPAITEPATEEVVTDEPVTEETVSEPESMGGDTTVL